jgi:succinate-semialdehyde dehydrogenase/glutarate-semialdehyde dehydrogenase
MTETFTAVDPATGQEWAVYSAATDIEVEAALATAAEAFRIWGRSTPLSERATLVRRAAELHEERRDELAVIAVREMGKPLDQSLGEVDFSAAIYRYYADHAEELLADEQLPLPAGSGTAVVRRAPLGPLLGIMPWNYPTYQVARFAAPNLVTGNTIILKHAPQCPETAAALQRLFHDAGFPSGTYVDLRATTEQIPAMIADPRVAGVSFTGSERGGASVAEVAGRHLKKVVLELGGSDPFLVLGSVDLDATVAAAVAARMENTGQACNAAKRFIVIDHLYDEFAERFTAAMLATAGEVAPLSSLQVAENLEGQVARAVAHGATKTSGGERSGAYFPPTVLTGVDPGNDVYREELFGPVAMLFRASSEREAVEIANDTPFGLGSYLFTDDAQQADRVADQIDAGMVFVNGVGLEAPDLPFGGIKRSGFGRELGRLGIDEFVNKKIIRSTTS